MRKESEEIEETDFEESYSDDYNNDDSFESHFNRLSDELETRFADISHRFNNF